MSRSDKEHVEKVSTATLCLGNAIGCIGAGERRGMREELELYLFCFCGDGD